MSWAAIGGGVLVCFVAAQRLLFLAPSSWGWVMYLANVVSETATRKAGVTRTALDLSCGCLGLALIWLGKVPAVSTALAALCLLGLELLVRVYERSVLTATFTRLDRIGLQQPKTTGDLSREQGYPAPSAHPELTINLIGPFVQRMPRYNLGTLLVGRCFELRLIIANHTIVPTQTGIRIRVETPGGLSLNQSATEMLDRLGPGRVHEISQKWTVRAATGPGSIPLTVEWGPFKRKLEVHFERCISGEARVASATITRYPGGCRSAFAWRGDMDLYDESTLQSIEGLEVAFGLGARYRMPQTMFLSSRLALDESAAKEWADHYEVDRGANRIPAFIQWMRTNVDLRHACTYPFHSEKRFAVELGNHGHLHFGTDTSGAPENGWKAKARMGAGAYPWLGEDRSSFGEQRDNAMETRRRFERLFGYTPKSWAMPNRTNDRFTAAAMEAAGCEVLSGSDITARHNVLLQPPPHHPGGTSAVELTIRHPGDPRHVTQMAMFQFWLHRAHRKCIPAVFMCHQHMHQFSSHSCARFTEYILRYALTRFNGDLHVNTVYGLGKYWREVLSPQTRRVHVSVGSATVRVRNDSDLHLLDVPLDVTLSSGHCYAELFDLAPGDELSIPLEVGSKSLSPSLQKV